VWPLFAAAALLGALDGLRRPPLDAMVPRLVAPEEVPAAAALTSMQMNAAFLAGPALAGVLLAAVPLPYVYGLDLVTFAASLAILVRVRSVPPPPGGDRPSLRGIVAGLRYARKRSELLGTYLVDMNAMFFGMPSALYPFVALSLGGPAVLGLLHAAPAVGAMLATATSGWVGRVHRHGWAVVLAAAGWGAAIVGFGLSLRTPPGVALTLSLACLVAAGAADMVSGLFRTTIWDQTIPDHLRGRLAGVEMVSYTSGPLLGNTEAGLAARFLGVGGSIVAGGLLCVVGTVAVAAALPGFLRYDGREGIARKRADEAAHLAGSPPA
jgi:MFS family permease